MSVPRARTRPRPSIGLGALGAVGLRPPHLGGVVRRPAARPRHVGMGLPIEERTISNGPKGTRQTLVEMARLAREAGHDPAFVMWCRGQVADLPSKDYRGEAKRLFDLVAQHVRYVQDPNGLELVQDPRSVLFRDGSGDCDEHACLLAAMAIALGHRAAFRTVGADKARPDQWSHVYALIGVVEGGQLKWLPADTTQRGVSLGWEPPDRLIWNKKDWVVA